MRFHRWNQKLILKKWHQNGSQKGGRKLLINP